MNINRNNYEEYFLLYADNELTQTEKKVVEIFVQENVDLKEEFLMIQMTVNSPEKEMKLIDKSFLIKPEPSFINEPNYQEIFILYHDNELSEEEKRKTEKFVAENLKYQNEFELIGKAKLVADDSIIYPDKKELYQKEKSGKVVPMILWRSVAAAIFIGFGLWIAVSYFNKKEVNQQVASTVNNAVEKPAVQEKKPKNNFNSNDSENESHNIASSTELKQSERKRSYKEIKERVITDEKKKLIAKTEEKTKETIAEEKIKTVNPTAEFQLASNQPIKEVPQTIEKPANPLVNNTASDHQNEIDADASKTNYAHTASYISDADQKNDNYVFYDVSTEDFKKSKVGGFLKKVKRIVERTNPITRLLGDEEQMAAK